MDVESLPLLVARYRPHKTYFIPHDLVEPIKDEELTALNLVDAIFLPDSRHWYLAQYTDIYVSGWIGSSANRYFPEVTIVLLPSEIAFYMAAGPDAFARVFAEVLQWRPRVKFPVFPGVETLERIAADYGCEVIAASTPSGAVIESGRIIVTNGLSSIVAEAVLSQRSVVCLADQTHPLANVVGTFASLPRVTVARPSDVATVLERLIAHMVPSEETLTQVFNYDLFFGVIGGL
jgi:hypothetical protein